jgi:hypothetical protein
VNPLSPAPIAVLDSSVLVPRWSRVVLQRFAVRPNRPYVPVWSEWIIAETWRVLAWQWIVRSGRTNQEEWRALARAVNEMLRCLLPVVRLVSLRAYAGPDPWSELTDRDDVPLRQTAQVAGALYVVSHDVADFPPLVQGHHVYANVEYLTAIEFIEDVLGSNAVEILDSPLPSGAVVRSGRAP